MAAGRPSDSEFPEYKQAKVADLVPYARNARTHSDAQVDKIAASIREFGFLNPVITDGENGIVAGHGRVMAAQKLGMDSLPIVSAAHLTDAQKRAYILADNRLALDADWDDEMLRVEFADLSDAGFDLELTGFEPGEIEVFIGDNSGEESEGGEGDENPYNQSVEAPTYEPSGYKPDVADLYDDAKAQELIDNIRSSSLPDHEQNMLIAAASRHTAFSFDRVADYYAHASAECQQHMEDSAMIIVDFNKAIEMGIVKLSDELAEAYTAERGGEE